MQNSGSTVYAVIPTFNRLEHTKECVLQLLNQNYPRVVIIISDGGSTDGTRDVIRKYFPSVIVLGGEEELWWGGAMARGIDWVLENRASSNDFVLMMNDDTAFDRDLIEKLIEASRENNAAVGAMTVDSKAEENILDGGTYLDWENYKYKWKTQINKDEIGCYDVDVLSGRGAFIPVYMIQQAGNVDAKHFPHYIGDYEFSYRLKQHGFRLGVTYTTKIRSHVDMTGLFMRSGMRYSIKQYIDILKSRRSMNNIFDHFHFIMRCAPRKQRFKIILRVFIRAMSNHYSRLNLAGNSKRQVDRGK
jgi:GT2 family glycosyltransferase